MKPTMLMRHRCQHLLQGWVQEFMEDFEIVGASTDVREVNQLLSVNEVQLLVVHDEGLEFDYRKWILQIISVKSHPEVIWISSLQDSVINLRWLLDGVFCVWSPSLGIPLREILRMATSRYYDRLADLKQSA